MNDETVVNDNVDALVEETVKRGIKRQYIKKIGKTYCVVYAGLLDRAHTPPDGEPKFMGFQDTRIHTLDFEKQECVVITCAVFDNGFKTNGVGHTSTKNIGEEPFSFHYVAGAETRAKARALKDALNIPLVSKEELINEPLLSSKQMSLIKTILEEMDKTEKYISKPLDRFGVKSINELTSSQADSIIKLLKKQKDKSNDEN